MPPVILLRNVSQPGNLLTQKQKEQDGTAAKNLGQLVRKLYGSFRRIDSQYDMRSTWDFIERTSASSLINPMSDTAKPFRRFMRTTTMRKMKATNKMVLMGLAVKGMSLNSSSPTNIPIVLVKQDAG